MTAFLVELVVNTPLLSMMSTVGDISNRAHLFLKLTEVRKLVNSGILLVLHFSWLHKGYYNYFYFYTCSCSSLSSWSMASTSWSPWRSVWRRVRTLMTSCPLVSKELTGTGLWPSATKCASNKIYLKLVNGTYNTRLGKRYTLIVYDSYVAFWLKFHVFFKCWPIYVEYAYWSKD